jgi:hypothetical protein
MALAVMCNDFKAIANHAVHTDDDKKIVRNHLIAMKKELATLKKEMEKRAKRSSAANPSSSIPTTSAQSRGPTPHAAPKRIRSGPQAWKTTCNQASTTNSAPTQDTAPTTQCIAAGQSHYPATAESGMSETTAASSGTSQAPNICDPRISNTKGRKRKHAFQNPLNLGKKEIRTCKECGSTEHDYRTCKQRGELPEM